MNNTFFYYDNQQCDFKAVEYNLFDKIIYNVSLWLLCGVVLAGASVIILSQFAGTPSEIALKAENRELLAQLRQTKSELISLNHNISELAEKDNEIYRSVLGLNPISYDERMAGVGGSDVYSDFDKFSETASELLKSTSINLETLKRRVEIQKISFNDIQQYYNSNKEKLAHIPATRPVKGVILSGFGLRYHPVLKYERMHEGLDFRAKVGETVFATGNGKIKHIARKGNYGRLIIIDHGFGFETRYAHLSEFQKGLRVGSRVNRGDIIGKTGRSGLVEGPHLHYEVLKDGKQVDPLNYLFADITPEEFKMFKEIAEQNTHSMD